MKINRLFSLSLLLVALVTSSCDGLPFDFDRNAESSDDSSSQDSEDKTPSQDSNDDTGKPDTEDPKPSEPEPEPDPDPDPEPDPDPDPEPEPEEPVITITSMSFEQSSYTIAIDESLKLNLNYVSNATEELSFRWISDNSSVCSVTAEGRVYGITAGIANITAYYDSNGNRSLDSGEKSASTQVRVYNPTMTIYLDSTTYTVAVNETVTASPSFDGGMDLNPQFSWKSNNTNIATVSNGVITGKSEGTTTIICYYDENKNSTFDSGIDPYRSASVTVESSIRVNSTKGIKYYPGAINSSSAVFPEEKYYSTDINVHTLNLEGEVPYIDFDTYRTILLYQTGFASAISNTTNYCKFTQESENRYKLTLTPGTNIGGIVRNAILYFDINSNTITCDNITMFSTIMSRWNNGVPNDMCSPTGIVSQSSKSKNITNPTSTTFELNRYNLHMYKIGGVPYIPMHVALSLDGGYDIYYYDGKKLLDTMGLSDAETTFFYSNKDNFVFDMTVETFSSSSRYKLTFQRQNSSNDFYAYYRDTSGTYNNFRATLDISNLSLTIVGSRGTSANTINSNNLVFNKTYSVVNNGTSYTFKDGNTLKGYMKLEDNDFNTDTIKNKMKEFNYNFLVYRLDYFYGLKNDALKNTGYTSFDTFFRNKRTVLSDYRGTTIRGEDTIYNQIMNSSSISEYTNMLAYIIAYLLGDGHTLYSSRSPLCGINANIDSALSNKYTSPRDSQLGQYYSSYCQQRAVAQDYLGNPKLKISGNTAIIQFDKFNGNFITATNLTSDMQSYNNSLENNYSSDPASMYPALLNSTDTYTAIYFTIKYIIPKYPIQNIVFDVTVNGGGAVLLLPQLTALMTDDPTVVYKDTLNGGVGEYHYEVDINGDGTYNASQDTFANQYNFYVLQSEYSFSCGNAFPSVCKNMGCAKIIGSSYSGGGACPVAYGYDAFGTQFQISARHNIMIKNSSGEYIHNDAGCPADKVVDSSIWYNASQLSSWINSNF